MKKTDILSASILSADFSKLWQEIDFIEKNGGNWVHIDVMDGHFVPNLTFGAPVVKCLRPITKMPFDVHLMVTNPQDFIKDFKEAGCDYFTFHAEAVNDAENIILKIKKAGMNAGISIKPDTPVKKIEDILPLVDLVLVMTVQPGFSGQKLITDCLKKITEVRQIKKEKGLDFLISADGGINEKTSELVLEAGAEVIVSGSAFFEGKLRK